MQTAELKISQPIGLRKVISMLSELAKVRITFFVAVSTFIGYVMALMTVDSGIIIPTIGVFLLAAGSSALNHYQERDIDALMRRTRNRPIPSGDVQPGFVLMFSISLLVVGSILLFVFVNPTSAVLGLLAFVWYNIIYTPLKMKNALAVVPGSLIGAIPPVIGWAATGRDIFEPEILSLALFFFIWQIPHFWLLLLMYSKDYEEAGFPTLTQVFNGTQLKRITYMWILALSISSLLIPFAGSSMNIFTMVILLTASVLLSYKSRFLLLSEDSRQSYRAAFMHINIYVLLVVLILSFDKLLLTVN